MPTADELPHYSYDDYKRWEGNWELIEGIPYAMTPSPVLKHQRISQKIAYQLETQLTDCSHCQALLSLDWIISEDTVVQPDNLVICHSPEGDFLTRAPVLIFEILSPSTAKKDRMTKFRLYQQEGVRYYCLVDPRNHVAKIYRLKDGRYIKQADASNESYDFDLEKCRVAINFSKIWPE
jgi:Uma2 family endonuclease